MSEKLNALELNDEALKNATGGSDGTENESCPYIAASKRDYDSCTFPQKGTLTACENCPRSSEAVFDFDPQITYMNRNDTNR